MSMMRHRNPRDTGSEADFFVSFGGWLGVNKTVFFVNLRDVFEDLKPMADS